MCVAGVVQLLDKIFVVVAPSVDCFSAFADYLADLGIGFTFDNEWNSQQLIFLAGFKIFLLGFKFRGYIQYG